MKFRPQKPGGVGRTVHCANRESKRIVIGPTAKPNYATTVSPVGARGGVNGVLGWSALRCTRVFKVEMASNGVCMCFG